MQVFSAVIYIGDYAVISQISEDEFALIQNMDAQEALAYVQGLEMTKILDRQECEMQLLAEEFDNTIVYDLGDEEPEGFREWLQSKGVEHSDSVFDISPEDLRAEQRQYNSQAVNSDDPELSDDFDDTFDSDDYGDVLQDKGDTLTATSVQYATASDSGNETLYDPSKQATTSAQTSKLNVETEMERMRLEQEIETETQNEINQLMSKTQIKEKALQKDQTRIETRLEANRAWHESLKEAKNNFNMAYDF